MCVVERGSRACLMPKCYSCCCNEHGHNAGVAMEAPRRVGVAQWTVTRHQQSGQGPYAEPTAMSDMETQDV